AEIAARGEDVAGARDDQRGERRVLVDDPRGSLDAEVHGGCQCIARLGPVDDAPGDRTFALEAEPRRAEFVCHGASLVVRLAATLQSPVSAEWVTDSPARAEGTGRQ